MAHTDLKWLVLDLLTPQMSLQKQLYKNKLREDFSARAGQQLIINLAFYKNVQFGQFDFSSIYFVI